MTKSKKLKKPEQSKKPKKAEKPKKKAEKPQKALKAKKAEKLKKALKPKKAEKVEKAKKAAKPKKAEKAKKAAKDQKPAKPPLGAIAWIDLTVKDAVQTKDFYQKVAGWNVSNFDMEGYSDFVMAEPVGDNPIAGICHARGANADIPPVWMIYIIVDDLEKSASRCTELGGHLVVPPRSMGGQGRFCVLQDPAGAYAALFEPAIPKR